MGGLPAARGGRGEGRGRERGAAAGGPVRQCGARTQRPAHPGAAELLPLRVGLAVADVLEGLGGMPAVGLKWPNDLMVADRKLGGILCEARWRGDALAWVAVGVGLNVRNPVPQGVRVPAARLADHLAPPPLDALARRVVEAAEAVGDQASADLGVRRIDVHEKNAWMLRSHLE